MVIKNQARMGASKRFRSVSMMVGGGLSKKGGV